MKEERALRTYARDAAISAGSYKEMSRLIRELVKAVREDERERCAKIADADSSVMVGPDIAAAIRRKGK
jgi:Arc/MetJ-type ribon-helix-helix transcriptional regulator